MAKAPAGSLVAALLAAAMPALAEAPPGASSCSGCHATSAGAPVPPLRGRTSEEITTAMAAFRSGALPATVMDRIAKGFSDEEARAIAVWFAAQK